MPTQKNTLKAQITYPKAARTAGFLEVAKQAEIPPLDPNSSQGFTNAKNESKPSIYTIKTKAQQSKDNNTTEKVEISTNKGEQDKEKLNRMITKNPRVLFTIKTAIPFQYFRHEITIEEDKISVIIRRFFASEEIRSSGIKDLAHVEVQTSIFFSTLVIGSRSFSDNSITVSGFKTEEAKRARRIIEGLRIIDQQGIDLTNLSTPEILAKTEEIGAVQGLE